VLPGKYTVAIAVPGVNQPLRGTLSVEADPLDAKFSATERRARQDALMSVYGLQKAIVVARTAAQTLAGQADSIKADLGRAGVASADSLTGRVQRLGTEMDRLIGIAGT